MNNIQKLIIAVAVVIGAAMIVCPPWSERHLTDQGVALIDHGYRFLWNKPAQTSGVQSRGVRIYSSRLSTHLMAVAIPAFILYVVVSVKTPHKREEPDVRS